MTYERLDKCPLCHSGHFRNYLIAKDHLLTGESFAIVECENCKLKFTNPRPSLSDIHKYYQSEDYISHSNKSNSPVNLIYKIARFFTLKSKLRLIAHHSRKKTLLDVGCGTGHFLDLCQANGWDCNGIEPDENTRKMVIQKKALAIYPDLKDLPENQKFDVITLWHVLEHVYQLDETLLTLHARLHKKGVLFIALPNCASWDANHYKEDWAAYDVPRHLYHFDPETFKKLIVRYNFKIKEILPQKLDAYYVSLLSEKYLNNRFNYYRAIINGITSNKFAFKSNLYSSLIYVISK